MELHELENERFLMKYIEIENDGNVGIERVHENDDESEYIMFMFGLHIDIEGM
jgi:hypothetical protein